MCQGSTNKVLVSTNMLEISLFVYSLARGLTLQLCLVTSGLSLYQENIQMSLNKKLLNFWARSD